jgi:hypothetical protein
LVKETPKDSRPSGFVEIGVGKHDERIVPADLKRGPHDALRLNGKTPDAAAHRS